MRLSYRLLILCGLCALLAAFWYAPVLLGGDQLAIDTVAGVAQLGGPVMAAACCFWAAWRSSGSDRAAWRNFGIGASLYVVGNVTYVLFMVAGVDLSFPALPEAAYFAMALVFAAGMFQLAKVRRRVNRVQIYNFLLIYCAVTLASLFTLGASLASSVMPPFATIVAFLYPALWFSVAAAGLTSLVIYDHGRKSLPFALMVIAVFAESAADYNYVLQLMAGTYVLGGIAQLLWVASAALIAWAAIDQVALAKLGTVAEPTRRARDRDMMQAAVPAAAVAIILLAGSASGALGSGPYVWLSAVLAVVFAVVAGLREYWVIHTQRKLGAAVETSRAELARSEANLSSVLESTSDSVLLIDKNWKVAFFNRRARELSPVAGRLELGKDFADIFPPGRGDSLARYRAIVETREPQAFEDYLPHADIWLGVNAFPTEDGLAIFFRDISDSRRSREKMLHMAHHDPLTGLANRVLFQERLEQAVGRDANVAVLLLDLDHFKEVNDSLGHAIGDAVLVETARRLVEGAGPTGVVARLGGDEFAIIVEDHASRTDVLRLAQRLIDAVTAPHPIDGLTVRVGASAGIALSAIAKASADQMLKNADIALYVAKSEMRGSHCVFEPVMEVGLLRRQALRADLAAALELKQFELHYQPQVDLKSNRVCGFEALLRWRHPTLGMIPPDVFIPIAEDTGLIVGIGDWVLRTACAEAATWVDDISVAVNLSTRQFSDSDLADKIALILEATGLEPRRLELEITESVLLKDNNANLLTLRRLSDMGLPIALDDFGTGYSSLGYLQKFPFSKIKIDRSFISGLPDNGESQAIVRSVIGLGQSLGMRVTAEGVETQAQLDWIRGGCDEAQGYLISKPVPVAEIAAVLGRFDGSAERRAG